jgi:uncharacterized protein
MQRYGHRTALVISLACALATAALASETGTITPLDLKADDVLATGNEWLALPEIRAKDGALMSFNVLSMRDRGLLQVTGEGDRPVLEPHFKIDGKLLALHNPAWHLLEYWIPEARQSDDGIELAMTYCAPNGYRAAFVRLRVTNHRAAAVPVQLGLRSSFGALSRVTYLPVRLRGDRTVEPSPWVDPGEAFSFVTSDTHFAWAVIHPGSTASVLAPPVAIAPESDAVHSAVLQPGETAEAVFILAAGVEEFSAAHNARALREMLDRSGSDAIVSLAANWCQTHTRTTGRPELDTLMNRNFLFTALYAWGRTIDTEQLVGVTSRSPRYYVSAAYWDRDAMLWSFPALLDIDPLLAREALDYALTTQLRNAGTHSRFIDGIVLEDGFQLDEAAAPVVALAAYERTTGDQVFLASHREALNVLRERLLGRYVPDIALYSSLQDSQDEYQKLPFLTYDNVLTWRALSDLAELYGRLRAQPEAAEMTRRAKELHAAILSHMITATAAGADGTIFASATDGTAVVTTDIPPGSLMKLPALGFIAEDDPLFDRTYRWLHSQNYTYAFATEPYGLPGSYRLKFTTSWTVADELLLKRSHERARAILLASPWDAGIVTEGIDPVTAVADSAGRAFATAAGYVAHAICATECQPNVRGH